jgi:hypothetical protein
MNFVGCNVSDPDMGSKEKLLKMLEFIVNTQFSVADRELGSGAFLTPAPGSVMENMYLGSTSQIRKTGWMDYSESKPVLNVSFSERKYRIK